MILIKRITVGWVAVALFFSALDVHPSFAGGFGKLEKEVQEAAPLFGFDLPGRIKELVQFLDHYQTQELNVPKFAFLVRMGRAAELAGLFLIHPQAQVFKNPSRTVAAAIAILGFERALTEPTALRLANDRFLESGESVLNILNKSTNIDLIDEVLTEDELPEAKENSVIHAAARSIALFEAIARLSTAHWKSDVLSRVRSDELGEDFDDFENCAETVQSDLQKDIVFSILTSVRLVGLNAAEFNVGGF